ncbi:hypothetical protein ABFX02_06G028700 [Erythranthe guttata]
MKTLTIVLQITPPDIATRSNQLPRTNETLHRSRRETPFQPERKWRLHDGAKGFTGRPTNKEKESIARKSNTSSRKDKKNNMDDDDKIPDVVWDRMISRILVYVGVPLAAGFFMLQVFSVLKEQGSVNVPKWVPFVTTFVTFGASALGVAYGSLSTSLSADEEGSLLGFEQVEKNWVEMWEQDEEEEE